jgi:GT2 family glycosyltransferase
MTQTSTRPRHSGHLVTAVLVCHDGARWLPEVLEALAAQTHKPERFVAADTGSTDGSAQLVTDMLGPDTVVTLPRQTPYGDAIQAGLDAFAAAPTPSREGGDDVTEWVWLLHDDCAPEPTALDELLRRVSHSPSVWLAGPKVRAWDGQRLLEAGLTIDPTGHVDTGFDGIERDQGQRDEIDEVLAVGTAGALIRRDVWDRLGGLDPAWATYADDVDLGWRVNAAGGRVIVASRAVVRHVRAQTVGRRKSAAQAGARMAVRRRSGMQVVLSNTASWLVPVLLARYVVGGLLRAVGLLLLSRRPKAAVAELRAVVGVLIHPRVVTTGRRDRARLREVPHRELRHLFPAAAARWRSSPFRVGRLGAGRADTTQRSGGGETGPVSEEAESLDTGDSALARFFQRPGTVLFLAMSLLALIAERHLLSSTVHGGRLLPAPGGASDLWSAYVSAWHPVSVGSNTAAPPSLAILAVVATVLLGKAWLAVDVIVLGAVPFAALSAYLAARSLTGAVRIRVWVAVVYALLPAVTGAVAGGRIDVAVVAILLPQLLRAGVAAVRLDPDQRSWRRSLGAGLLLAIGAAFAPMLWLVAVPILVVGIGFLDHESSETTAPARQLAAAAVVLIVPLLVLSPWSWDLMTHPRVLLDGSGLPEFYTAGSAPSGVALALLRAGGAAQPPIWIGIPILAAALLSLNRQSRVAVARTGVALLIIGIGLAVAVTRTAGVTAGLPASRHWPGLALLVAGAGALLAALVAAVGARPALRGQNFGWRQPAAVAVVGLAVISTLTLAVGWLVRGADRPLNSGDPEVLPLFTQSELTASTAPRALVLDTTGQVISYALVRRPTGPQLGDADTAPRASTSAAALHLADAVRDLVAGRPGAGDELAPFGIKYVVAPTGSAARVSSALGRATTLTVVPAPGATVWRSSVPTGEVTLLDTAAASAATNPAAASAPISVALPAKAGSADVDVPAGAAGRLVVLAEPADSNWHASVDGKPLIGRTVYGWAQAFELPSSAGRLRIGFSSGARHWWLVGELAVVVVVVVGAMLPGRRPDDEDAAP